MHKETTSVEPVDISVNLGGMSLHNPVCVASGTFGYGKEYEELVDISQIGAVIVKGTTLEPRAGNAMPRIMETPSGMLNAIGLENPGIKSFLYDHLPYLRQSKVTVIANIAGNTVEEYAEMAAMIDQHQGVAGIELNISCPNVKQGGIQFGTNPDTVFEVVKQVKKHTHLPVMPKLSPNVTDIVAIAQAAEAGGANALSMINTLMGMAIDVDRRKPYLANIFGGLSGPAIKPVALRMIYQVYRAVKIPILGGGGIMNCQDALEFILVGSTAVSVGTGNFINPRVSLDIIDGLQSYLQKNHFQSIKDIVGLAHQ